MGLLLAGVPVEVPGTTISRLCGSGLDAVDTAARAIKAGKADLVLAGGVESMTRAPLLAVRDRAQRPRRQTLFLLPRDPPRHHRDAGLARAPSASVTASARASWALIHTHPRTGLDGKFSMQYALAAVLLDGRIGLPSFDDAMVLRAEVQACLPRVASLSDTGAVHPRWADVTLNLRNGTTLRERAHSRQRPNPDYRRSARRQGRGPLRLRRPSHRCARLRPGRSCRGRDHERDARAADAFPGSDTRGRSRNAAASG